MTARAAGASTAPVSRAASGPSAATTIADAASRSPPAMTTSPGAADSTVAPKRSAASGRPSASWRGMACMPAAGSAASPSEKSLKTKAKSRLEVSSVGSRKMPPRNGRKKASIRSLEKPSRRSASAVVTCGAVRSSFSEKRESRRRSRATRSLSGRLPGASRRLWTAWSG